MLELNIGLSRNIGGSVSVTEVIASLQRRGFVVVAQRVVCAEHAFGNEDTLVVRVVAKQPGYLAALHQVSLDLDQDCIAVCTTYGTLGWLVGPHAAKWGNFDPAYFHHFAERRWAA